MQLFIKTLNYYETSESKKSSFAKVKLYTKKKLNKHFRHINNNPMRPSHHGKKL